MKNILFLETGTPTTDGGAGGSVYSLLELVKGIKDTDDRITILFYNKFNIYRKFEELNCNVIIKNKSLDSKSSKIFKKSERSKKNNEIKIIRWLKDNLIWLKLYPDIKYIKNVITENNIELLHCNDRISTNFVGIIAAKLAGIKVIVHQRQYETSLPLVMKLFGKTVNRYFAVSNSIAENLISKLFVNKDKVEVMYNWISEKKSTQTDFTREGRKILWIGRIVPWKGTHILVDFVEHLVLNKFQFDKVVVYGGADTSTTDYFDSIKKMINDKKLNSYFDFKGYIQFEEIEHSEFMAYLHTSINPEPFGRTIIEAMSKGIPVFATNLGGVKDIIINGKHGFLYNIDDLSELYEKFDLINNKDLITKIISDAKIRVNEEFSGKKQIHRIKQYYNYLLEDEKNYSKS